MKWLLTILLSCASYAGTSDFEAFRTEQRQLVLAEFKQLYKKRHHVHQNLRQTLHHARSKKLRKGRLSLFQPRTNAYELRHPAEQSHVYFFEETAVEVPSDEISGDTDFVTPDTDISGGDVEKSGSPAPVRAPATNPWIRR